MCDAGNKTQSAQRDNGRKYVCTKNYFNDEQLQRFLCRNTDFLFYLYLIIESTVLLISVKNSLHGFYISS